MATAVIKIDESTHSLVAHGATALHMTQKDLVAIAVREFMTARRDQINAQLRAVMQQLDGTAASHVAMLTGLSRERLDELGGVRE